MTSSPGLLRASIHAALVLLAVVPWIVGLLGFGAALLLVLAADWVWPDANRGNCWSFVGPRWVKHGGYIVVRPADGVRVLGRFWVPHAFWMPKIGMDNVILQTHPATRSRSKWLPWRTLYFEFRVRKRESPHNSDWADL